LRWPPRPWTSGWPGRPGAGIASKCDRCESPPAGGG
jgi:hypothetical protein